VPFATEFILISRQEEIQLKADLNCYKNLHQRALLKINNPPPEEARLLSH
jgi:hypothetical protein